MRYTTDVMSVENKVTKRVTHYKRICEVWRRISADDMARLWEEKESCSNLSTTGAANPKSAYIRHFTTLNYNFPRL